jgi:F-type H+-transporting ATPase subunit delta
MRAASRDSYAAALDQLESVAGQTEPADLAAIAEEILSVAEVLAQQPRLRRALSDPGRESADRVDLLRSLLAGKMSARGLELLSTLVGGRWSTASELLEACERLGVEALLASADRADELREVEDELFRFGRTVDGNAPLALALGDSMVPVSRRAELVRSLLAGKANPATVRLVSMALTGFGGRGLAASVQRLVEAAAQRRDRQVAYVTVASILTEEEERRLSTRLFEMYGRQIALKISVAPEILGGMSVRVGSDLYDGTIVRRLAEARSALT